MQPRMRTCGVQQRVQKEENVDAAACFRISDEPSQIIRSATKVMIPSPTQESQNIRSRSRAIQLEATPISATDRTSPNASSQKWSRAMPATASTLSSEGPGQPNGQ